MSEKLLRVTRRDFFTTTGIIAFSLGLGLPLRDTFIVHLGGNGHTRSFWETIETATFIQNPEILRKGLEKKYGIEILQGEIEEIIKRYNIPPDKAKSYGARINWPAAQLVVLDNALSQLPPHFYKPRNFLNGIQRPLRIGMIDDSKNESYALVSQGSDSDDADVKMERLHLRATIFERRITKKAIAHELVHFISEENQFQSRIDQVKDRIGLQDLGSLRTTFKSVIEEYSREDIRYKSNLAGFSEKIGYGATNFQEFWSVAAEFYLDGAREFVESYSRFIKKDKAEYFYIAMRDGIFKGWEYK